MTLVIGWEGQPCELALPLIETVEEGAGSLSHAGRDGGGQRVATHRPGS